LFEQVTISTTTVLSRDEGGAHAATLPVVAVGAVVAAALVALLMSLFRGEETTDTAFDTAVATVGGSRLVELPDEGIDPAVGLLAPTLRGDGLSGAKLRVPTTGKPTVVLFLAHWCPHCRAEVPVVRDWVEAGRRPTGAELVGVATAMDPTRPNYPTSGWLDDEGWTVPVIADADNHAAFAYGLSAFPFWVAVGADGRVVERLAGELTAQQIDALFAKAAAS
jgi:cytochrome c biogenesis protein CcmG/thiol:disulfide interchange protein DsbE